MDGPKGKIMSMAINLPPEMEARLQQLAAHAGQSVDGCLARLVSAQAPPAQGGPTSPSAAAEPQRNGVTDETDDLEDERPWRGVFAPPRPRQILFTQDASSLIANLPKRKPTLNMEWHRTEPDDA
jgi:hypothetical protein